MHEWLYMLRTELRLLLRGITFKITIALAAGYAVLIYVTVKDLASILHWGYFIRQFQYWFLFPVTMLAIVSSVYKAREDRMTTVDQLLHALPYSSYKRLSGKLAAILFPFIILSAVPVVIWLTGRMDIEPSERMYVAVMLASASIPLAFIICAGFVAGYAIKGRISYAIALLIWFAFSPLGLMVYYPGTPIAVRDFLNVFIPFGYYMDYFTGFNTDITFWLYRGFYFALAVSSVLLTLALVIRKRKEQAHLRLPVTSVLITLSLAVGTGAAFFHMQQTRMQASVREAERIKADELLLPDQPMDGKITPLPAYRVNRYEIEASLLDDKMEFHVMMNVESTGQQLIRQLELTLWDQLDLNTVQVNGQAADYSRQHNFVTLTPAAPLAPNKETDIVMTYSGAIDEWRPMRPYRQTYEVLSPLYTANQNKLLLPSHTAWYPLPGKVVAQQSFKPREMLENNIVPYDNFETLYSLFEPAHFLVTVNYPSTIQLESNLKKISENVIDDTQSVHFEGAVYGVSLFGGSLKTIAHETPELKVKAIASKLISTDHMKQFVRSYHRLAAELSRILHIPIPDKEITLVIVDNATTSDNIRQTDSIVRVSKYVLPEADFDFSSPTANFMYTNMLSLNVGDVFSAHTLLSRDNQNLWAFMLKDYMSHKDSPPYRLSENGSRYRTLAESFQKIEAYMNAHSNEEIEAMIRRLHKTIRDYPLENVDVTTILKG
ncbi:hypothetical protein [Paenibacillus sp. GCM10012303]|uniref:hypothetical protein n=1 Tax=Paenibacillus sp. GCM10012303 TaxID=3317340 RepID=UPI0036213C84